MTNPFVEFSKLTIEYPSKGGAGACARCDRTSPSRRAISSCIVGPSGCGKTTLLQDISRLHPGRRGEAWTLAGEPITGPGPDRGVPYSSSPALFPWMSGHGETPAFGPMVRGLGGRAAREDRALSSSRWPLGISATVYPYQLSGGMQAAPRDSFVRSLTTPRSC